MSVSTHFRWVGSTFRLFIAVTQHSTRFVDEIMEIYRFCNYETFYYRNKTRDKEKRRENRRKLYKRACL
jgi:hypothetical protein